MENSSRSMWGSEKLKLKNRKVILKHCQINFATCAGSGNTSWAQEISACPIKEMAQRMLVLEKVACR